VIRPLRHHELGVEASGRIFPAQTSNSDGSTTHRLDSGSQNCSPFFPRGKASVFVSPGCRVIRLNPSKHFEGSLPRSWLLDSALLNFLDIAASLESPRMLVQCEAAKQQADMPLSNKRLTAILRKPVGQQQRL
jgi:hypothetical protein